MSKSIWVFYKGTINVTFDNEIRKTASKHKLKFEGCGHTMHKPIIRDNSFGYSKDANADAFTVELKRKLGKYLKFEKTNYAK